MTLTGNAPCRVLIVDDSAVVRQMLTEILSSDPAIDVVGTAADPLLAREKIKRLAPDVITLDVEMPRMDGLAFLENLMRLHPLPVVMISSLTERGADTTLQALALGAVDFVSKPKLDVARGLQGYADEIIAKVKMAARSRVRPLVRAAAPKLTLDAAPATRAASPQFRTTDRLIAIGSSAGGTEANAWTATRPWLCARPATAKRCCPAMPTCHPAASTCASSVTVHAGAAASTTAQR